MWTRRDMLRASSASICLVGIAPTSALGARAAHGPMRIVRVEPTGEICANATVWLDSGPHRVCLWSACAGPVPSTPPAVSQRLSGVIEVEVDGQRVVRASTRAWTDGHRISLPGVGASLWIQTERDVPIV